MSTHNIFFLAALVFFISGCAQTSAVMLDSRKSYAPTSAVEILIEKPQRNHVVIAMLEATGPVGTPLTQLIESMRLKAQAVGADAVIPTENASRNVPQGIIFNQWLGGYQTIGGGNLPIIRGIAIKYEDN